MPQGSGLLNVGSCLVVCGAILLSIYRAVPLYACLQTYRLHVHRDLLLKWEAVSSYEVAITIYKITLRYNPGSHK
jgi:hypothetical protein